MSSSLQPEESAPPQTDAVQALDRKGVTTIITVLVISAFLMILNETVLSVALPNLMAEFNVDAVQVQWLTTGFLLTMAVVIPTTGFLTQRFTTRTLFTAAISLFIVGTLVAALAPSVGVILLGRIIQAGGTAIVLPLLMVTTLTLVAPARRGTVMGLNSVVISVAPAIGPTLSGLVVNTWGWRWIFGAIVPLAVILLIAGYVSLKHKNPTRRAPLDILSVALSAVAFGGLVYGLASISSIIGGSMAPLGAFMVGLIALAIFVQRQIALQRKDDSALLNLKPFKFHNFRIAVTILVIAMGSMLGTVMVLPIYLQNGRGFSVLEAGLVLLPGGLIQGIASPFIGRLYDKLGALPLVLPGAALLAGGLWWMTTLDAESSLTTVIIMNVVFSLGMAMVMTPLMTTALGSLPRELYGHGSAILNTLQQLGGAAGTAGFIAALSIGAATAASSGSDEAHAVIAGADVAFSLGGILGIIAIILALFLRKDASNQSA